MTSSRRAGGPGSPSPRVFVYWDYACPYSYIVAHRLDLLARERPLDPVWRPLAPDPSPPAVGPGEALTAPERQEVERSAREAGLPLRLPSFATDTRNALQAAELARDIGRGAFARLHAALFRAYLAEGRDIGDPAVLLDVARTAGVDAVAVEMALEDGRYERELDQAREEAGRYGIRGTPTLLFGRFMVVGAAPLEELRRAAELAAEELAAGGEPGGAGTT